MVGMRTYRRAAHTVYELHYHFVFTTKYRKPVLRGDLAVEVRDLIRQICRSNDIEILAGHVRPDHVHLLLSVPPHLAPSRGMQAIKGKTSHVLLSDRRKLRREFWGQHLWARGYFGCSSGNVTDEMIEEYIRNQDAEPQDDQRFKISE
jgi:putative transposase